MSKVIDLTTLPAFSVGELHDRQDRARAAAAELGLAGLVTWGRGGSQQDGYAEVHWLTGFYNQIPLMFDGPGWTANGHCAVVLDTKGPATLLANAVTYDESGVVADVLSFAGGEGDLLRRTAAAITALAPGQVGLLGGRTLPHAWFARLQDESGRSLLPVDELGPQLRSIKSPAEQDRLRLAGTLGSACVDAIMDAAVPGATEAEAVAAGLSVLTSNGGALYGMGVSSGPLSHTYGPSSPTPYDARRPLQSGDLFRIDIYGSVDGYCFDFGRTRAVGADPTPAQRDVIEAARDSVRAGVQAVRPGVTFAEIAKACRLALESGRWGRSGRGLAPAMGDVWGHAVGNGLEPPWITDTNRDVVEAGMCLAVERRIVDPGVGGATYEENFLVTERGIEMLTTSRTWAD